MSFSNFTTLNAKQEIGRYLLNNTSSGNTPGKTSNSEECDKTHRLSSQTMQLDPNVLAYWGRVHTYTSRVWQCNAPGITPLHCARYGWVLVSDDVIQCVDCKQYVSIHLPSAAYLTVYESCCKKLQSSLTDGHDALCHWRSTYSPECYQRVPLSNYSDCLAHVTRYVSHVMTAESADMQDTSDLPRITVDQLPAVTYKSDHHLLLLQHHLTTLRSILRSLQPRNKRNTTTPLPYSHSEVLCIVALALCGWKYSKENTLDMLECELCKRRVGLWRCVTLGQLQHRNTSKQQDSKVSDDRNLCVLVDKETVISKLGGDDKNVDITAGDITNVDREITNVDRDITQDITSQDSPIKHQTTSVDNITHSGDCVTQHSTNGDDDITCDTAVDVDNTDVTQINNVNDEIKHITGSNDKIQTNSVDKTQASNVDKDNIQSSNVEEDNVQVNKVDNNVAHITSSDNMDITQISTDENDVMRHDTSSIDIADISYQTAVSDDKNTVDNTAMTTVLPDGDNSVGCDNYDEDITMNSAIDNFINEYNARDMPNDKVMMNDNDNTDAAINDDVAIGGDNSVVDDSDNIVDNKDVMISSDDVVTEEVCISYQQDFIADNQHNFDITDGGVMECDGDKDDDDDRDHDNEHAITDDDSRGDNNDKENDRNLYKLYDKNDEQHDDRNDDKQDKDSDSSAVEILSSDDDDGNNDDDSRSIQQLDKNVDNRMMQPDRRDNYSDYGDDESSDYGDESPEPRSPEYDESDVDEEEEDDSNRYQDRYESDSDDVQVIEDSSDEDNVGGQVDGAWDRDSKNDDSSQDDDNNGDDGSESAISDYLSDYGGDNDGDNDGDDESGGSSDEGEGPLDLSFKSTSDNNEEDEEGEIEGDDNTGKGNAEGGDKVVDEGSNVDKNKDTNVDGADADMYSKNSDVDKVGDVSDEQDDDTKDQKETTSDEVASGDVTIDKKSDVDASGDKCSGVDDDSDKDTSDHNVTDITSDDNIGDSNITIPYNHDTSTVVISTDDGDDKAITITSDSVDDEMVITEPIVSHDTSGDNICNDDGMEACVDKANVSDKGISQPEVDDNNTEISTTKDNLSPLSQGDDIKGHGDEPLSTQAGDEPLSTQASDDNESAMSPVDDTENFSLHLEDSDADGDNETKEAAVHADSADKLVTSHKRALEDGEVAEEGSEGGASEGAAQMNPMLMPPAKRRKTLDFDEDRTELFDVISQHHSWCPWVAELHTLDSPTAYTHATHDATQLHPGWRYLLHVLLTNYNADSNSSNSVATATTPQQLRSNTGAKKSLSPNDLREIRKMLKSWTK